MGLTKVRLGELIEQVSGGNEDRRFSIDDVRGISVEKSFIHTKANLSGVNLANYTVVAPGCFSFVTVTSRNGGKISIAYNDSNDSFIVSPFYVTFRLNDLGVKLLDEHYLFMLFNRGEFDRYARSDSWGSAREYFYYDNMADVQLILPPIDVQRKYVAIYESMLANQRVYESGLDDIKLTCDALLDRCKLSSRWIRVGDCVSEVDRRNSDNRIDCAYGININKEFMPSKASSDDLRSYKLVFPGELAYSSMQTGRDKCIRIALHEGEGSVAVSPAYSILHMKQSSALSVEYLMAWFSRPESDRLGWFLSDASIRANLDLDRFLDIEIPVPEFNVQVAITSIYRTLRVRTAINKRLKTQLRDICPILIRGSIEEAYKQL